MNSSVDQLESESYFELCSHFVSLSTSTLVNRKAICFSPPQNNWKVKLMNITTEWLHFCPLSFSFLSSDMQSFISIFFFVPFPVTFIRWIALKQRQQTFDHQKNKNQETLGYTVQSPTLYTGGGYLSVCVCSVCYYYSACMNSLSGFLLYVLLFILIACSPSFTCPFLHPLLVLADGADSSETMGHLTWQLKTVDCHDWLLNWAAGSAKSRASRQTNKCRERWRGGEEDTLAWFI